MIACAAAALACSFVATAMASAESNTAALPAAPSVFVLAIGNNRSLSQRRPDLRYADDDAVKYGVVFRAYAETQHIEVLTRIDVETQATLQPEDLATGLPRRADLDAAVQRLRQQVAAAQKLGRRAVLYFFFAGHGDQRQGKGFLELEDQNLGRDDLRRIIEEIGAERAHLVLDSCNSFFVIHPRRPGGRVWATANDAGELFSTRATDVGVLLSTSAEAQVFEWSQLQAGIFSHAVRSGLLGGADANSDGLVTYGELDGFVAIAGSDIENSLFRPHLYVKPPSGDDVFIDLRVPRARVVELAGFSGRTTLRDARGVRLLDVHPETGFSPRLVVPGTLAVSIISELPADSGRTLLYERELEPIDRLTPDMLIAAAESPRGSDSQFAQVFAAPFGPVALGRLRAQQASDPMPVYGLTQAQEQRFTTQLRLLAEDRRRVRLQMAGLALTTAIAFAAGGTALLVADIASGALPTYLQDSKAAAPPPVISASVVVLGGTVIETAAAAIFATRLSDEEKIFDTFDARQPRSETDRATRVIAAVARLDELKGKKESSRQLIAWAAPLIGTIAVVGGIGMLVLPIFVRADPATDAVKNEYIGAGLTGVGLALVGMGLVTPQFGSESPAEIYLDIVRQDPEAVTDVVK